MKPHPPYEPSERDDLREFLAEVRETVCTDVLASADRFPDASQLVAKFDAAVERLFERGWDHLNEVIEVHNELCVADLIRQQTEPACELLLYEPALDCEKRFDFKAQFPDQDPYLLEVKTIHPEPLDAWEKYETALAAERFPQNARLLLDKTRMGGELYHKYFSARAKMLAHARELEQKIAECLPDPHGPVFLVLISNGFDWHIEDLQDFLYFYRYDRHFEGDHFSAMEQHFVAEEGISLSRTIDHFSYIKRSSTAVRPARLKWNVRPVHFSPEEGFF